MDARYRIRPAALADAPALVAIERRCFSDPWSEAAFREALSSEWTFTLVADGGATVLRVRSEASAGSVAQEIEANPQGLALACRWKVDRVVQALQRVMET